MSSPDEAIVDKQTTSSITRGSSVVKPVAVMMIAQALDKGFYLLREMLVSARFGASALTDAFNVGLYISNFILTILRPLIEDTFIPVYVEQLAQDRENAQQVLETVALLILLMTSVLTTGVYIFAPQVVSFVAPGFPVETLALATRITRVMAVFTLILALTNFVLSVLTAHKSFLLVGLSPLIATAVVVVMIWSFSDTLGIQSLTWGMVAGTLVQLAILAIGLRRRRLIRLRLVLRFREVFSALGTFTLLMFLVRLVGMGVGWVDRSLSSRLVEGSIAALGFALNIYQLPFQVCVLAVTTVVIAQFSWHVAQDNLIELKRDFALAVRIAAFFLIPSTVALIILRQPIVQLLYERGAFEAQDTAMTSSALLFYALGLVPQSIVFISVRLFLARKEPHYVLLFVIAGSAIHILLDLILIGPMQQAGIALATSVGVAVMSVSSLWLIRWKLGPLGGRMILTAFAKIGLASLGMGLVIWLLLLWRPISNPVFSLALLVVLGLTTFFSLAFIVRLTELHVLFTAVRTRLK